MIQHIKSKVEVFRNIEVDFAEIAVFIKDFSHILLIEQSAVFRRKIAAAGTFDGKTFRFGLFVIGVHDDREELAAFAVQGGQSV